MITEIIKKCSKKFFLCRLQLNQYPWKIRGSQVRSVTDTRQLTINPQAGMKRGGGGGGSGISFPWVGSAPSFLCHMRKKSQGRRKTLSPLLRLEIEHFSVHSCPSLRPLKTIRGLKTYSVRYDRLKGKSPTS